MGLVVSRSPAAQKWRLAEGDWITDGWNGMVPLARLPGNNSIMYIAVHITCMVPCDGQSQIFCLVSQAVLALYEGRLEMDLSEEVDATGCRVEAFGRQSQVGPAGTRTKSP